MIKGKEGGGPGALRVSLTIEGEEVCEAAFLVLLGYQTSKNASDAPAQWRAWKKSYLNPFRTVDEARAQADAEFMASGDYKFNSKRDFCVSWIQDKAEEIGGDTFASEEGATESGELKNIEVLPWCTKPAFYEEFHFEQTVINRVPEWRVPSADTFYRALRSLKKRFRLMRCKGNIYKICYMQHICTVR